jgi:hypothetical protein
MSVAGLAAAGLMLHFAFRGPRRAFAGLLVAALVLYAVSALFADAGTHGWDSLKVFPSLGGGYAGGSRRRGVEAASSTGRPGSCNRSRSSVRSWSRIRTASTRFSRTDSTRSE